MKKFNKKIWVLVLVSLMVTASPSYATMKLEFTGPLADILNKIEKAKEKIEDVQSKILKEKEKWTKKAEDFMDSTLGTEGSALFKEYVVKSGAGIVKSALKGQFNAGDFSLSGLTDGLKSQLGNYKLDYATLAAKSRDSIEALDKANRSKTFAMDVQMAKLKAEWDARVKLLNQTDPSDETYEQQAAEIKNIAKRIAELQRQKEDLVTVATDKKAVLDKYQGMLTSYQNMIADYSSQISHDTLLKQLNAESIKLYAELEKNREEEIYNSKVEKLFLGKYEVGMSVNKDRIRKARKEEYFASMKNLVYIIVNTYKSIGETEDKMKKCEQARDNAQAIFGQEAMRVCIDVQVAKVAAQYMEMLIGRMRFESSAEIQRWVDVYKLSDYDRDFTKFNLDNYVVTEDDFKNNLKKSLTNKVNGALNNFKGF